MWEKESAGHRRRRSRGLVQISGGKVVVDFSDREYRARGVLSEAELSLEGWRSWKRSGAVAWGCQRDEDLTVDDEVR